MAYTVRLKLETRIAYPWRCCLQKLQKLVTGKTGLFEDREKRTALERSAVEGNGNDARVIRVPVVAVGGGGMVKEKACALQSRMTSVGVYAGRRPSNGPRRWLGGMPARLGLTTPAE